MPRGGRRSGAGAPRGNHNALTHGLYSKRVQYATLLLAASPSAHPEPVEGQLLVKLAAGADPHQRIRHQKALRQAFSILTTDPQLAGSIKEVVHKRLKRLRRRIQEAQP